MIAAAMALLLAEGPNIRIQEVASPDATVVRMSMVVRAPSEMTQREQAAWHVLMHSARKGNTRYTFDQMVNYGVQGDPSTVLLENSDDLLFIQLAVPRSEDLRESVGMIAGMAQAIVLQPKVGRAEVEAAARDFKTPVESDLKAFLMGYKGEIKSVTSDDVRRLWLRVARPEQISVVITSSQSADQLTGIVQQNFTKWSKGTTTARDEEPRSTRWVGPQSAQLTAWGWSPMKFTRADAPKVLALVALGTGKTSAAFRTVREQMGASYLQMPFFLAGADGWEPRFVFGSGSALDEAAAKKVLLDDVATWDSGQLARAIMLSDRSLRTPYPLSPFFLRPSTPYNGSERQRLDWIAFAALTDSVGTPEALLESLNNVTLEELKAAAKSLLDSAIRL